MAHIRYDIIPQGGGWSIAMGGAVGPPYPEFDDALRDTENVAALLAEHGDHVAIVIWRNGTPHLIDEIEPAGKRKLSH